MKKFFLTATFAALVTSPALAATSQHLCSNAAVDTPYAGAAYAYAPVDVDTVVADGKVLGRDPDIFIRQSLLRQGDAGELKGN